jgi:hypothetical protein
MLQAWIIIIIPLCELAEKIVNDDNFPNHFHIINSSFQVGITGQKKGKNVKWQFKSTPIFDAYSLDIYCGK